MMYTLIFIMCVYVKTYIYIYIYTCAYINVCYLYIYIYIHTRLFLWIVGTLQRRNGFYTVQTVFSIALHLPLTGNFAHFYFLKKTHSVWFISFLKYGEMGKCPHKSPSPCNTCVIPMSLYTFVSSCHTHTHTHTHRVYLYTLYCQKYWVAPF